MALTTNKDTTVPVTVQTRAAISPNRAFEIMVPIDLRSCSEAGGHSRRFAASRTKPKRGTILVPRAIPTYRTD